MTCFHILLSCSYLIGNKFKEYPQVEPVLTESVGDLLLSLSQPMSLLLHFLSFVQLKSDRAGLVSTWCMNSVILNYMQSF